MALAGVGAAGAGLTGVVGFFLTGCLVSHGHLLLRVALHSSRRSFTTSRESVNLLFSCNKLSIMCALSSIIVIWISLLSAEFSVELFESLQLVSISTAVAIGNVRRVKNHLFDGLVVMIFPFFCVIVYCIDKNLNFVKLKMRFVFFSLCRHISFLL